MTIPTPKLIKAAQGLFIVNAAIWLLIGALSLVRMKSGGPLDPASAVVIAILIFINAGAMLVAGLGIGTQRRLFYYFGIALMVVNIVLTITDQLGIIDYLNLAIEVCLLGLLLASRTLFFFKGGGIDHA